MSTTSSPAQTPTEALQDVLADAVLVCSFFPDPPVAARLLAGWILGHYGLVVDGGIQVGPATDNATERLNFDDIDDDDLVALAERHLAEAARLLREDRERWRRILPASVVVDFNTRAG